jgi:uncharacterized protein YoaH (UPF0181 family)
LEIKQQTKNFVEAVNSLMEKGIVSGQADVAKAIKWSTTSLSSAMKLKRNVPKDVYKRFTDTYKITTESSAATSKDEIIALLRQNNKLLEDQLSSATGELRHISVMNFAMLKTMRKAVAKILAKVDKEDLLEVSGRLDKETSVLYRSVRERGSLIDLGI